MSVKKWVMSDEWWVMEIKWRELSDKKSLPKEPLNIPNNTLQFFFFF